MLEVLQFLAAPFAACAVLVAILGYLGLHVLEREIIFVDLALAQIAAFGALVGFLFGHEPHSVASLGYALASTAAGAAIFSFTRTKESGVPQEALIGITYVVTSAATIIVADLAPEGAEHIKDLLAGSIVWVTWRSVARILVVCAAVGLFHYLFRRRFLAISESPEKARAAGVGLKRWDFLFYISFGLVITVAVEVAGVLMVFAYLVAPAIVALASSSRWRVRLLIAWVVGGAASAIGLLASYRWDYPSGPAIVCALGLLLLAFGAWRGFARRPR
ncbi:MAG: metal ABC transporter permease [Acidobacteriota bacterium]|nr:metal ABC transporter permease [Acidobacteriota bacterium]MDH3524516.1 metal ABC transporter permease [Acidobacteriota bacterium]